MADKREEAVEEIPFASVIEAPLWKRFRSKCLDMDINIKTGIRLALDKFIREG
jgi:hypothetical protein